TNELAVKLSGRLQTSKAWSGGLLVLDLFALAAAGMAYHNGDDMAQSLSCFVNFVNFGSGFLTASLAALQFVQAFKIMQGLPKLPALARKVANLSNKASAGFGVFSGVLCIVGGAATALDNLRDPAGSAFLSGAFQFLGGVGFEVAAIAVLCDISPAAP